MIFGPDLHVRRPWHIIPNYMALWRHPSVYNADELFGHAIMALWKCMSNFDGYRPIFEIISRILTFTSSLSNIAKKLCCCEGFFGQLGKIGRGHLKPPQLCMLAVREIHFEGLTKHIDKDKDYGKMHCVQKEITGLDVSWLSWHICEQRWLFDTLLSYNGDSTDFTTDSFYRSFSSGKSILSSLSG